MDWTKLHWAYVTLQALSAISAFAAAWFWHRVGKVSFPSTNAFLDYNASASHVEQIRSSVFDQGELNKKAAYWAVWAASLQGVALVIDIADSYLKVRV